MLAIGQEIKTKKDADLELEEREKNKRVPKIHEAETRRQPSPSPPFLPSSPLLSRDPICSAG